MYVLIYSMFLFYLFKFKKYFIIKYNLNVNDLNYLWYKFYFFMFLINRIMLFFYVILEGYFFFYKRNVFKCNCYNCN